MPCQLSRGVKCVLTDSSGPHNIMCRQCRKVHIGNVPVLPTTLHSSSHGSVGVLMANTIGHTVLSSFCWDSMSPRPMPDASVSRRNSFSKFEYARAGAWVRYSFS